MAGRGKIQRFVGMAEEDDAPPGDPCVLVIFGASGDLTRRLLMPAIFNLQCDGLLSDDLAILGVALDEWTDETFRERMTAGVKEFTTRKSFDSEEWERLASRMYYMAGKFDDPATFHRLTARLIDIERRHHTRGNVLFYMAVPPAVFSMVSRQLAQAQLNCATGMWRRLIIEKPFGRDLTTARALNRDILADWAEDQIYRIDHYMGKETVQNLLAFRFSTGLFEPVWNRGHVDHIQFTVAETVGVEKRGKYFETSGMLRDMVQNHMLQMLAYVAMEVPANFRANSIRNEKAKVLEAVRVYAPEEVRANTYRGQYGAGKRPDGTAAAAYRDEPDVSPTSNVETFAAMRLFIDNWRWEGVPIYLRTGKNLWKRGADVVVQFKQTPEVIFRDTPAAGGLRSNKLIFHIQPDQGIELRFSAKTPGPRLGLQPVNMRFDYREAFEASRGTGYEVLVYNCMIGDQTLFLRSDLVEVAWRIVQPILDHWAATPPEDFPNYRAGSWGPKAMFDLIEADNRRWQEVVNRSVLERVPLFASVDDIFLHQLAMMLYSDVYAAGDYLIKKGEKGQEMFFLSRGQVEVLEDDGTRMAVLEDGSFFGETGLLLTETRMRSVRAITDCDVFVLAKSDFRKVLHDHPEFAKTIAETADARYQLAVKADQMLGKSKR